MNDSVYSSTSVHGFVRPSMAASVRPRLLSSVHGFVRPSMASSVRPNWFIDDVEKRRNGGMTKLTGLTLTMTTTRCVISFISDWLIESMIDTRLFLRHVSKLFIQPREFRGEADVSIGEGHGKRRERAEFLDGQTRRHLSRTRDYLQRNVGILSPHLLRTRDDLQRNVRILSLKTKPHRQTYTNIGCQKNMSFGIFSIIKTT